MASENSQPETPGFRISLKWTLLALVGGGVAMGLTGRLWLYDPQFFSVVVGVASTAGVLLLALITLITLGVLRVRRGNGQWGLLIWSLLLMAAPFVGVGTAILVEEYPVPFATGLARHSNSYLISRRIPKNFNDDYEGWYELENRVHSGRLNQAEVEQLTRQFITHMKDLGPNGWDQDLSTQEEFLHAAVEAGLLKGALLKELCDTYYGASPTIKRLPRLRQDSQAISVQVEWEDATEIGEWSECPLALHWDVDSVKIDGEEVILESRWSYSSSWSAVCKCGELSVGQHELSVVCRAAYVQVSNPYGTTTPKAIHGRDAVHCSWSKTAKASFSVFAEDQQPVRLETDIKPPALYIQETLLKNCVAVWPNGSGKKLVLQQEFEDTKAEFPYSFDVAVKTAKQLIPLDGGIWSVVGDADTADYNDNSSGSYLAGTIDDLPPAERIVTLVLTPNPEHIFHRQDITEIWGKEVRIPGVPLLRFDLERGADGRPVAEGQAKE